MARWKELLHQPQWDVVYINGLWSRWSTLVPLWLLRGTKQRRIVAVRGMLAHGMMRQKRLLKRVVLRALRTAGCFRGVEFQATNQEEVEDVRRWVGRDVRVHLVPNLGRRMVDQAPRPIAKPCGELRLVSVARIAQEKNTLFALEQLSGLPGRVHLDLYGTVYHEAYWERCRQVIAALPPHITVKWHGQIDSEAVPEVLERAHALFISDRTPWRGLEAQRAGWDLPLEKPERFREALRMLVDMDDVTYHPWSDGAFALAVRSLADPAAHDRTLAMFQG
jgi:glycosyltransferase involved in cell wall biosynthesis